MYRSLNFNLIIKSTDLILGDWRETGVGSPSQKKIANNMFRKLVSSLVWPEHKENQ